jgi:hypothetical protein
VKTGFGRRSLALLVLIAATLAPAGTAHASPSAGKVQFVKAAESGFEPYVRSPSAAEERWMRDHYWRMRTYPPYFDSRTSWYPRAWAYKDAYAIYEDEAATDDRWILRDMSGRRLYIPWGCSGGSCPQYAADVGDPSWRRHWIDELRRTLGAGYRGVFIDDVNLGFSVSNGSGDHVAPRDPRTGREMSEAAWQRYFAEFLEQVRAELPGVEIVHNQVWFQAGGTTNPQVRRAVAAADYLEVERGFNDRGIRGGGGPYGFQTLLRWIDHAHSTGAGVVLDVQSDWGREYALATYFLASNGRDGLGNDAGGMPDAWWAGYDVDLGAPRGRRYTWNGVYRRDFERGMVLVNQPDAPRRKLAPGGTFKDLRARTLSSVTLGAAQGAVLLGRPGAARSRTATSLTPVPNPLVAPRARAAGHGRVRPRRLARTVLVRGRVRGARGGRVRMGLERAARGRWVRVRAVRLTVGRGGRFRRVLRGVPRGRYRVRARYTGSARARASTSGRRRFAVRR